MKHLVLIVTIFLSTTLGVFRASAQSSLDYLTYHRIINEAESLISNEAYSQALLKYEQVFGDYDFVFLRDYKIAAQLAWHVGQKGRAFEYIERGIEGGWTMKALKGSKYLKKLREDPLWKKINNNYQNLRSRYLSKINGPIKDSVERMFKKDQKKALGVLVRIGQGKKEKYSNQKFGPHSETQMTTLIDIINLAGYPGEQVIGNDFWMSTIISHHNSISQEYVLNDTLYNYIRPRFMDAIAKGQMSPYEYALADDWHIAVSTNRSAVGYGFLNPPHASTLSKTNKLRAQCGLRAVELRNALVDIEGKTAMKFYLPDWVNGKIKVE